MPEAKIGDEVKVSFYDTTHSEEDLTDVEASALEPARMTTRGRLVAKTKGKVVVVSSDLLDASGERVCRSTVSIPRGAVISITKLVEEY